MKEQKYRATVHTMGISVGAEEEFDARRARNHSFVTDAQGRSLILNPHRMKARNGKYEFQYLGASEIAERGREMLAELGVRHYSMNRLDICIDARLDYEATEKMTRLILLVMAHTCGMGNRYSSLDPLSIEMKTTRIQDGGEGRRKGWEAEHYNRALKEQTSWTWPVTNRLELRRMLHRTETLGDIERIAKDWDERLQRLQSAGTGAALDAVNDGLMLRWEALADKTGKNDIRAFNKYLSCNTEHIFTRNQLKELFACYGENPEARTVNFLEYHGDGFERFTDKNMRREIEKIRTALFRFERG